jgi:hypothetical protein
MWWGEEAPSDTKWKRYGEVNYQGVASSTSPICGYERGEV